jgi:antitoxin (DNA-binding transcriptional repressor) of toxin-antitoxin stability system
LRSDQKLTGRSFWKCRGRRLRKMPLRWDCRDLEVCELESPKRRCYDLIMTTTADLKDLAGNLPGVITQVLAGNEVILTNATKPIARILPIPENKQTPKPLPQLKIWASSRPRVLTPKIAGAGIAEEMFNRE